MKAIILTALSVFSLSAFGYKTGTYNCKSANPALPDNVYEISDLDIDGKALPFIHMTRYHLDRETGEAYSTTITGIAAVARGKSSEYLTLNNFRLEFVNDKLVNCKQ